jgi:hypothetical protein
MDFSSAFFTFLFNFQESVILSNPGKRGNAVPRALAYHLGIDRVQPINLPQLLGERAEAVHDPTELSLGGHGPPRVPHRVTHRAHPHVSLLIPVDTESCCWSQHHHHRR